jgi:CBS domain containing-hemolysin-like protein
MVVALVFEFLSVIARKRAAKLVTPVVVWLRPFLWLISPLAVPIVAFSRTIESLVPDAPVDEQASELAVERVIEQGEQSGSIPEEHAKLLKSVLEFEDIIAREVMVPRTRAVAIDIETPLDQVLSLVIDSGHSRYPVYRERLDQVEGLLYAKDLFRTLKNGPTGQSLAQLIRKPPFFVAESQKLRSLLREMQSRRVHLAVVVDEFGGTSGIVTLEDILEEIVGDIRDEHDIDEAPIQKLGEAKYLIDAEISVRDLEEALGTKLPESDGEYDSLGGLLVQVRGRVPQVGEVLQLGPLEFHIRESDARHVRRVEVHRISGLRTASSPNHDVTSVL